MGVLEPRRLQVQRRPRPRPSPNRSRAPTCAWCRSPMRTGISNFFANLETPTVMINDALQGKFLAAANDLGRFLLNTTVGIGGHARSGDARPGWSTTRRTSARPSGIGACTRARSSNCRCSGPRICATRPRKRGRHLYQSAAVHQEQRRQIWALRACTSSTSAPRCCRSMRRSRMSTTRTPSFAMPTSRAAPTWCPTARSPMSRWSTRSARQPRARRRAIRAISPPGKSPRRNRVAAAQAGEDRRRADFGRAVGRPAAPRPRSAWRAGASLLRNVLVAQSASGRALRDAQPLDQQGEARRCRCPSRPARSMTAARPAVDRIAPDRQKRAHGAESRGIRMTREPARSSVSKEACARPR